MVQLRVKARDAWWTVTVIDPIAAGLLRRVLGRRWLSPNRITGLSVGAALAASICFFDGALVLGACLYQVSFLLDCMDGKVAATRGIRSAYGAWIDSLADAVRLIACYPALAFASSDSKVSALMLVAIAVYPVTHFSVISTGAAWPGARPFETVTLPATFVAFARAIPQRLGSPLSSVDAEAVVFSIGPLTGHIVIGTLVGAVINLLHFGILAIKRLRATGEPEGVRT
jgi:phosphatidylglycerophosphate synthase